MNDRLAISVTHADGRVTRWGADEADPTDIPGDLTFTTRIPGGDGELSCSLLRRIDIDYPDQGLLDEVRVYGAGGREVWRGRMEQFPRSHGDGFQIVPGAVGLSAELSDNPTFREIYVDRDLSRWMGASVQRRINLVGSFTPNDPTVLPDSSTGQPSLFTGFTGSFTAAAKGLGEALYTAAPLSIGSVYYAWKTNTGGYSGDANWTWNVLLATSDVLTTSDSSGNLRAVGPGTGTVTATAPAKPYAAIQLYYATGPAGADNTEYGAYWTCLAVYGTHGLTKQGTDSATSARGFYASDVVRDIVTRTAPGLTIGEIEDTTFVIPHLVFLEPTTGEAAIQAVNDYHRFDWGVYDGEFFYRSTDPDRLTWRARLSSGAQINFEGETAGQVYNGVYVTYQDPSGQRKTVGPPGYTADATDSQLADPDPLNPYNVWGKSHPYPLALPDVTTLAGATQLGAIALTEHLTPQRRGTLTLTGTVTHPTMGEVPVSWIRAGDYVSIADHPADVPRRIIETRYTHGTRQNVLTLDNTPFLLDSIIPRVAASNIGVL